MNSLLQKLLLCSILLATSILLRAAIETKSGDRLSHIVNSKYLNEERIVDVQLPSNYGYSTAKYPVLYVLDGEWAFSYACGVVNFLSNELTGFAPEMIVVGISNTNRVRDMSMDEDESYLKFMDFIALELIPIINETYRANDFRIIYGWSSAGSISSQFLFDRPEVFKAYIESGSGIGEKTYEYAKQALEKSSYNDHYFYANCEGDDPRRIETLNRYHSLFTSLSLEGIYWNFEVLEGQSHLQVLASGVENGLKHVFANYKVPKSTMLRGLSAIKSHFKKIDELYNYNVEIPEGIFIESASILSQNGKITEAVEVLEYGASVYPFSSFMHLTMGEIFEYEDDLDLALEQYQKAMDKAKLQDQKNFLRSKSMLEKLQTIMSLR